MTGTEGGKWFVVGGWFSVGGAWLVAELAGGGGGGGGGIVE